MNKETTNPTFKVARIYDERDQRNLERRILILQDVPASNFKSKKEAVDYIEGTSIKNTEFVILEVYKKL